MFNENWINKLEFHKNTIPFSITTLKFGNKEIIVPNVSSLTIKFITYSNKYKLIFGAFVEDVDLISKIAELPISADEMETIKTNSAKLTRKCFRNMIKNKFNLDLIVWNIKNSIEIQFILKNPHQDNHFDCVEIMQDVFNKITS